MDQAMQLGLATKPTSRRPRPIAAIASLLVLLAMIAYSLGAHADLDRSITLTINRASRHGAMLDHFFLALTQGNFISGSVMVGLIWYAWFQFPTPNERVRLLTGTIAAVVFGMGSRVLQLVLPSHLRPLHDPMLAFHIPAGVNPEKLSGWSSFPSDHAAVYFGLAFVLYRINTRLGVIALVFAALFDFARIYLGYHYTSDIVGGAALGVLGVALALRPAVERVVARLMAYETNQPGLFYMAAFIASFGLATLFFDARVIASGVFHDLGF